MDSIEWFITAELNYSMCKINDSSSRERNLQQVNSRLKDNIWTCNQIPFNDCMKKHNNAL